MDGFQQTMQIHYMYIIVSFKSGYSVGSFISRQLVNLYQFILSGDLNTYLHFMFFLLQNIFLKAAVSGIPAAVINIILFHNGITNSQDICETSISSFTIETFQDKGKLVKIGNTLVHLSFKYSG